MKSFHNLLNNNGDIIVKNFSPEFQYQQQKKFDLIYEKNRLIFQKMSTSVNWVSDFTDIYHY